MKNNLFLFLNFIGWFLLGGFSDAVAQEAVPLESAFRNRFSVRHVPEYPPFIRTSRELSLPVLTGDERIEAYLSLLEGKRTALYSNHTGLAGDKHILDLLLEKGVKVSGIFSPEHGFRGKADAGEHVSSSVDTKTGVPVWSLYGSGSRKPDAVRMKAFDVLVVDIQDVGLRFYTYYITMRTLMDACALYGKEVLVLDRPNPNGHLVDGPVLQKAHYSGVGCLPIPVLHGMTLGELALMINGEGWLTGGRKCPLTVIPCSNYTHHTYYRLPVAPSPNLLDMKSVYLYPSTCLFEGTVVSLGRGTPHPFQVYGHPKMRGDGYSFTPRSVSGAKHPPLLNQKCYGVSLSHLPDSVIRARGFHLEYLIDAYRRMPDKSGFFTPFFEKLVGVDYIRTLIQEGKTAEEIRAYWKDDVEKFRERRRPYLLYAE